MEIRSYNKQIIIPSTVGGVDSCLALVKDLAILFNLDFELLFSLQTITLESVENAIVHGNKNVRDLFVFYSLELTDIEVVITVEDQGEGFNIESVPSPLLACNLRKESGRGLFFIKSLSKECYTVGKGNILIVKINR